MPHGGSGTSNLIFRQADSTRVQARILKAELAHQKLQDRRENYQIPRAPWNWQESHMARKCQWAPKPMASLKLFSCTLVSRDRNTLFFVAPRWTPKIMKKTNEISVNVPPQIFVLPPPANQKPWKKTVKISYLPCPSLSPQVPRKLPAGFQASRLPLLLLPSFQAPKLRRLSAGFQASRLPSFQAPRRLPASSPQAPKLPGSQASRLPGFPQAPLKMQVADSNPRVSDRVPWGPIKVPWIE